MMKFARCTDAQPSYSCRARRTSASFRSKPRRAAVRWWHSDGAGRSKPCGMEKPACSSTSFRPKRSATPSRRPCRKSSTSATVREHAEHFGRQRFGDQMEDAREQSRQSGRGSMIRHNRLLVAFHVVSDALLGLSAFIVAYALRFHTGIIPGSERRSAAAAVHQRPAVHRRRRAARLLPAGPLSSSARPIARGRFLRGVRRQHSRGAVRHDVDVVRRDLHRDQRARHGRARSVAAGLGRFSCVLERGADVCVARVHARGARTPVARRDRSQENPDCRMRRPRPPGRRQDPRTPRARVSDRRLRRRQAPAAIISATADSRCSARSTTRPRSPCRSRSITCTSPSRRKSTCACSNSSKARAARWSTSRSSPICCRSSRCAPDSRISTASRSSTSTSRRSRASTAS